MDAGRRCRRFFLLFSTRLLLLLGWHSMRLVSCQLIFIITLCIVFAVSYYYFPYYIMYVDVA